MIKKPVLLIVSLGLPFLVGAIGSYFTISSVNSWYVTLNKPSFSPPNFLFGPVWSLLYVLMGTALYLVWQKADKNKKAAFVVKVFLVHLIFNGAWSIIFFGMRNIGLALADILIMLVLIVYIISLFKKVDKRTQYLLLPYLAWVSFATLLNFTIWQLN